jgi:hypothetical protein
MLMSNTNYENIENKLKRQRKIENLLEYIDENKDNLIKKEDHTKILYLSKNYIEDGNDYNFVYSTTELNIYVTLTEDINKNCSMLID